jgi:hypothetical protein
LESDVSQFSGFVRSGFGFGGRGINAARLFQHDLGKEGVLDRVGELQPEMIFGDIANKILFGVGRPGRKPGGSLRHVLRGRPARRGGRRGLFPRVRASLKEMQANRKAAYARAQEQAIFLTQLAHAKGEPPDQAKEFPSPELCGGFVNSLPEIARLIGCATRLEEAKARFMAVS